LANALHPPAAAGRDQAWKADLTTQSGIRLFVRPARASNKAALTEFFRNLSPEDRRLRFRDADNVGEAEVAAMLAPGDRVMTFLAFDEARRLIACCSLFDEPGGETAEVTLSVGPDWKDKGVSWTLLEHALAYAKAHGLKCVRSIERGDDRDAINLEHEMGFVARLLCADPVEVSLCKFIDQD